MKLCKAINSRWVLAIAMVWWAWCGVWGQKNDYNWLIGQGSQYYNPQTIDSEAGVIRFDFNYNPVQIGLDLPVLMNFDKTDVCMSDSNGNILFYSNGIYIANGSNLTVANGDSLNYGYVAYYFDGPSVGEESPQAIIALPNSYHPNQYYLVHSFIDSIPGTGGGQIYCAKILNTLVDMNANGGLGQVIYKNQPVINAECNFCLTAVKHGNGRDWWMAIHKLVSDCYYMVLIDSTGPHVTDSICLSPVDPTGDGGPVCFSPDGSKFIYFTPYTGLSVYDFDRCTGVLNKLQYIPAATLIDSGYIDLGVSVSPNSRYLYVSTLGRIYQMDLWSDTLLNTIDTVGVFDGAHYGVANWNYAEFSYSQLAPDGKIYIRGPGALPVYHVINNPDERGTACNFAQHSVYFRSYVDGIPNYPNYRLGSLTQSQCDTLGLLSDIQRAAKEQIIKVYPNPATDYVVVDYGFTDWNKGQPNLEICNTLGQVVYGQVLPMYSGLQKIDVGSFASGIYTVFIKRGGGVVATQKMVIGR